MAFKDILQHFKFVNLLFWCHEQVICQEIPRIIILTSSIFIICKDLYTISWKSQPSDFMIILFLTHVVFTIFFLFAIWICTKNSNIGNLSTEIQVQFFRETEMAWRIIKPQFPQEPWRNHDDLGFRNQITNYLNSFNAIILVKLTNN